MSRNVIETNWIKRILIAIIINASSRQIYFKDISMCCKVNTWYILSIGQTIYDMLSVTTAIDLCWIECECVCSISNFASNLRFGCFSVSFFGTRTSKLSWMHAKRTPDGGRRKRMSNSTLFLSGLSRSGKCLNAESDETWTSSNSWKPYIKSYIFFCIRGFRQP